MSETIVAMYDSESDAEKAVRDLQASGVPASAISRHGAAAAAGTAAAATAPKRDPGFWQSLFGGEPENDAAVYEHGVSRGAHVVSVQAPEAHTQGVTAILERYNPVDIEERAKEYGIGRDAGATAAAAGARATTGETLTGRADGVRQAGRGAGDTGLRGNEETLRLAEEQLVVGKRLVNRGTTRIRRFVVETPVQEDVSLHSETVSVERRPVTGAATIETPDFTDRIIEVTETEEEAVVNKTARVREEVVVRKGVADRTETVRDTVRREDVEITKEGGDARSEENLRQAASATPDRDRFGR